MSELINTTLQRYSLETQLRPGRLGQVFKAKDTIKNEIVALKIMQTRIGLANDERARMLQRLQQLKTLVHPNIVKVLDAGDENAKLFVVTEYVEGDSLLSLLQRYRLEFKPIELPLGLSLMRQAADALAEATRHEIVHGDLKPDNLLLISNAKVGSTSKMYSLKISDFTLTRLGDLSDDENFFGSPAYISPEQCQGLKLSSRSDLYALGIIMYETFTGLLPFEVKNIGEAAIKHLYAVPRRPREIRPEIPLELESLILRLLSKHPGERPSNAVEVRDTLQAILERIEPGGPSPTLVIEKRSKQPFTPDIASPQDQSDLPRLTLADNTGRVLRVISLNGSGLTFGRAAENDILLNADTISRCHFRIDWDGEQASITDLGSSNGTSLDAQPLPMQQALPLPQRGIVRAEPFWLRFEAPNIQLRNPIGLALEEQHIVLAPGSTGQVIVRVANLGRLVDHFAFGIEGIPQTWLQLPTHYLQLNPGHQAAIHLGIKIPRTWEAQAGEHKLQIVAHSRDNRNIKAYAPLKLTVLPFANSSLQLKPGRRTALRQTKFVVVLGNQGNMPLYYQPNAEDIDSRLRFQFEKNNFLLEPGQERKLEMKLRAPIKLLGFNSVRHFTVMANASTDNNFLIPEQKSNTPNPEPNPEPKRNGIFVFLNGARKAGAQRGQGLLGQMGRDVVAQLRDGAFTGRGVDLNRVVRSAQDRVVSDVHVAQRQAVQMAEQNVLAGGAQILNKAKRNPNETEEHNNPTNATPATAPQPKHPTLVEQETSQVLAGANPAPVTGQFVHRPLLPIWLLLGLFAFLALLYFLLMRPPSINAFNAKNTKPFVSQDIQLQWEVNGANKLELRGLTEKPIAIDPNQNTYLLKKGFTTAEPHNLVLVATGILGAKQEKTLEIKPQFRAPIIKEFNIYPKQLIKGQPVIVTYKVENAKTIRLEPFGEMKRKSGRLKDYPIMAKTYSLIAQNGDKKIEKSIELKVDFLPPEIIGLSITPRTVVKGKDLTMKIYVKTRNASSVEISDLGSIPESTIQEIATPQATKTYVLTVKNSRGVTRTRTFTVNVVEPPKPPEPKIETPKPTSETTPENTTQTSVQVVAEATKPPTPETAPTALNSEQALTPQEVAPPLLPQTINKSSKTAEIEVQPNSKPTPTFPKPTAEMNFSTNTIGAGQKAVLFWKTNNAKSVRLEPIGTALATTGKTTVSPNITTNYTLVVLGQDGSTLKINKKIIVNQKPTTTESQPINAAATNIKSSANPTNTAAPQPEPEKPNTATQATLPTATPPAEQNIAATETKKTQDPISINVAGQWYHNSGDVLLTQDQDKIVGVSINRFNYSRVRLEGVLKGNVLAGTYRSRGRNKSFTWYFDNETKSFSGGSEDGAWCGARAGASFNDGCSFSGEWITSFSGREDCNLKLVRTANTAIGNYCEGTVSGKIEFKDGTARLVGVYKSSKGISGNFIFALAGNEAQDFRGRIEPDALWCGWRPGRSKPNFCGLNN